MRNTLFIIPARGGSKGILKKNIKPFLGKPLLHYTIEFARNFVADSQICLSTDDNEIIDCAEEIRFKTPFIRPSRLASDQAGTFEVLQHALNYYDLKFPNKFNKVLLLQPTSPIRANAHLEEMYRAYSLDLDMIVSVHEPKSNPYFNQFEEDQEQFLVQSKGDGSFIRRQDLPPVYEYNGSMYLINAKSIRQKHSFQEFSRKRKFIMSEYYSLDIDTNSDWEYAESYYSDLQPPL